MIDRSKGDAWQPDLRHVEHITISGNLSVPLESSWEKAPKREGWKPYWVNINLKDERTQKVVFYQREQETDPNPRNDAWTTICDGDEGR